MGSHTPQPSSVGTYSFMPYPAEYAFSPGMTYPPMPPMDHPGSPYSPHPHFPSNLAFHMGHPPPSPITSHSHLPPSPPAPSSPGRSDRERDREHDRERERERERDRVSTETKMIRQLCTTIAKMQGTMKDLAERQTEILDRMSLLEQRSERANESIERILENTEMAMEDSKSIRTRVEDNESQDAFETRLTDLMDNVVEKLIGGIGQELKEIKKMVNNVDRYNSLRDPFALAQRVSDADLLGEEEQEEVKGI